MSKAKLIELIKMTPEDLNDWWESGERTVSEVQDIFRLALKDQDHDTRQGCAEEIDNMCSFIWEANSLIDSYQASSRCINYQDKDLEGL